MKKAIGQAKFKMHWWIYQRQVQEYGRHSVKILFDAVPNFWVGLSRWSAKLLDSLKVFYQLVTRC